MHKQPLTNRHGVLPPMDPRERRHIFGIPFERRIVSVHSPISGCCEVTLR